MSLRFIFVATRRWSDDSFDSYDGDIEDGEFVESSVMQVCFFGTRGRCILRAPMVDWR